MGLQTTTTTLLVSILFILCVILLQSPSNAKEGNNNILFTGEVLPTGGKLYYKNASFVMQDDCNLVLYNNTKRFQSDTADAGTNCTLTLTEFGKLVIKTGEGSRVWYTKGGSKKGEYVAVVSTDGNVNVFEPSIWSTPFPLLSSSSSLVIKDELINRNSMSPNVLFSSEALQEKSRLESRNNISLELTEDCNLEMSLASVGVVWQSNTKIKGLYCFLTLDTRGRLVVLDRYYQPIWKTNKAKKRGKYVLLLHINGQALVYGPVLWSTDCCLIH